MRRRQRQIAVLDAFETGERRGKGSHSPHRAPQHDYFHAVVMIQMDVRRSDNLVMCMVLHIGELFLKIPLVVIVHQRQHPDCLSVRILDPFFRKSRSDEIPKSFGSGPVTRMVEEFVKFLEEVGVD